MKNKRILMSLAMLLVSAIMLSSASYAWFSMNTEVEVEGIEFVAYSDSLFLEISKDNQTFTPNDISADLTKKYLRPISYGTVADMGGAYTVTAAPATGRFVLADDPADQIYYYRQVGKADSNDTGVAGAFDYYCVNEELRSAESTTGLYILGNGVTFTVVTTETTTEPLFERIGNNYVAKTLAQDESAYGYYTVATTTACGADDVYSSANTYYEFRDGNYYLAGGLDEGSHLEGYYTLNVQPVASPAADTVYHLRSEVTNNDPEADFIAFKTAAAKQAFEPETGYWFRGYSESLNTEFGGVGEADHEAGRINGVIRDDAHTDENTPYYLHTTYYLRMGEASALASNLRINSVEVIGSELDNSLTNAVRVMLVVTSNVQTEDVVRIIYNNRTGEFTREDNEGRIESGDTSLFYERFLGDHAEVVTVKVYMYYDGTDANVNTNYALDFSGHTVNLEFGIDTPDYLQ